ncbi:MAG: hypothetical protein ABSF71_38870 [Terriglobia bacterium]
MRKLSSVMALALVLFLGAPKAHAGTTTYTMIFTVTSFQNASTPPTGYFTYDTTANQFTSFVINWDGLGPIDISSTVNTSTASSTPACPGVNNAQANFFIFTVPACGGTLNWDAIAEPDSATTFELLFGFSFPSITGKFEAGKEFAGSVPNGTGGFDAAEGTLAVVVQPRTRPPVGGWLGQIIRMVAGPVYVPPGVPVEFTMGFVDVNGNAIGPSSTNTLSAGETATLDLDVNTLVQQLGQRIEVRPVVTAVGGAPGAAAAAPAATAVSFAEVTEVIDKLTGFGQVLIPDDAGSPANPAFEYQGLAGGQTMRFNVYASAPNSCSAILSFVDVNSNPIGSSQQVSLPPGMGTSLDLNANTLGLRLGKRIEVKPVLTVVAPVAGVPANNSDCRGSVEVFGNLAGKTWTYQSGGN